MWVFHVYAFCFSDEIDTPMETALLASPKKTPTRQPKCDSCHKFIAARDPHPKCWRCRVACTETRCSVCEGLSAEEFYSYREYVDSQARKAAERIAAGSHRTSPVSAAPAVVTSPPVASGSVPVVPPAGGEALNQMFQTFLRTFMSAAQPVLPVPTAGSGPVASAPASVASSAGSVAAVTGPVAGTSESGSVAGDTPSVSEPGDSVPSLTPVSVVDRVLMASGLLGYIRPPAESAELTPSVAKNQAGRPTKFNERSFPLSRLVSPLRRKLDSAFEASHLRSSPALPPPWKTEQFAISSCPFSVASPTAEAHTEQLGITSPPSATVSQAVLQQLDTTARRCLTALSHADTYSDAACELLDPASDRDQQLFQFLYGIGESLAYLTGAVGSISSQILHTRRLAYLDLARLDAGRKESLMQQPWSSQVLFNHRIPGVVRDQDVDEHRKATHRVLDIWSSVGRGKPKEYYASKVHPQGKGRGKSRSHKRPFPGQGGSGSSSQGSQPAKAPKGGKPKGYPPKGKQA